MTKQNNNQPEGFEEEEEDGHSKLPVDRGWAWVILVASCVQFFLVVGYYKAFGILFIELQLKFNASSSLTSLVTMCLNISYSLSSLLMTTVGIQVMSTRIGCMAGSSLICISLIISAYTTSIEGLVVSLGLILGIGFGMLFAPTLVILGQYFKKRHGMANCIGMAGGSAGSLVFPQLVRSLLDTFGLSGALLVLGGIMLQGVVAGSLMTPVDFYTAKEPKIDLSKNNTEYSDSGRGSSKDGDFKNEFAHSVDEVQKLRSDQEMKVLSSSDNVNHLETSSGCNGIASKDLHNVSRQRHLHAGSFTEGVSRLEPGEEVTSPLVARALFKHGRARTVSEVSKSSIPDKFFGSVGSIGRFASNEFSVSSMLDVRSTHSKKSKLTLDSTEEMDRLTSENKSRCSYLARLLDCSVFKRCPFLLFLPCAGLIASSSSVIMTYIAPCAKDLHFSDSEISTTLSIIGAIDLCALVIWGFIADREWFKRHHLIAGVAIIMGIVTQFLPYMTSGVLFTAYCVIYGLCGRVYFSIYPVVLVDFLGLENLRNALAACALIQAASIAAVLVGVGAIRDVMGSYIPGYQVMGGLMILGACGILTLPLGTRCDKWRESRRNQEDKS